MKNKPKKRVPLYEWIRSSYIQTALIPLFILELVFLGIYFGTSMIVRNQMTEFLKVQVDGELSQLAETESQVIEQQLIQIRNLTLMYAEQTRKALTSEASLEPADEDRLAYSSDGAYYTVADRPDSGGAAVFYSGYVPVGQTEREKVARVLAIQDLMKDITRSHPLAVSLYLNTFDSLNVIYPYFDVISQYTTHMNIPSYNFYYEADADHNPDRSVRWTDVYLDPAGHGWMASAIAPVYSGDFLEGVVGVDMTADAITRQILDMSIPWQGYGILVGQDGTILALPPQGESDWGLTELTDYHYSEAILSDTFKPDQFNLFGMDGLGGFAEKLTMEHSGFTTVELGGKTQAAAWHTIKETGWKLLLIAPESVIYARVSDMTDRQFRIGVLMLAGMILFYGGITALLTSRAHRLSMDLARPLVELNAMVSDIGTGSYQQKDPCFGVAELQQSAMGVIDMGRQLGETHLALLETQEKLKAREANLKAIVHSIDDIIVEMSPRGETVNLWTRDHSIVSVRHNRKGINRLETILDPEAAKEARMKSRTVLETGIPQIMEYRLETGRGHRWFQARISMVSGDSGNLIVSARDITDRKQMEQSLITARDEAEKASQAKTEFLSNMSHELRTPLNAVLGFAQLLQMDRQTPLSPEQTESVEEITKAGKHLLELINEVLDLARIENGKMSISIEPVQINGVVEEVLMLMKPLAEKNGIEITRCQSSCAFEYILADALRIKQVIINLMSNAIKYNRENGKVHLSCERVGEFVRFRVADTGKGIPQEYLQVIFQPFHRLGATKNTVEGTGVGLAVVSRLMSLMNGTIRVESQEGVGSTFTLMLPLARAPHEQAGEHLVRLSAVTPVQSPESDAKTVLYIEDNPANLTLVERIIARMPGLRLISATQGTMGIDLAKAHIPSLILVDIDLPDFDGYEVLRRLKRIDEVRAIPKIVVSASAMTKDIEKGRIHGFDDYITKPIDIERFVGIVRKYTDG